MPNCTKCGAALEPGATQCDYCDSLVETQKLSANGPQDFASSEREDRPRFKNSSVIAMAFLMLITLGLYCSVWFFTRREGFRKLAGVAAKKTDLLIGVFVGVQCIFFILSYLKIPADSDPAHSLPFLALLVLYVFTTFFVRGLMRSYADRALPQGSMTVFVAPSVLWTLLFGILYLQAQINKMIAARLCDPKA